MLGEIGSEIASVVSTVDAPCDHPNSPTLSTFTMGMLAEVLSVFRYAYAAATSLGRSKISDTPVPTAFAAHLVVHWYPAVRGVETVDQKHHVAISH